jgi:GNAT superfamily N-acetyltransferase
MVLGIQGESGADAEDGSIVGQYTVSDIPVVTYGDMALRMAVSVDTVVRKDFQRQGIFIALATMVYERLTKKGYRGIITYPGYHRNSTAGLLKLGFERVCPVMCATGRFSSFDWRPRFFEKVDSDNRPRPRFRIRRVTHWLRWRFQRPSHHYIRDSHGWGPEVCALTDASVVLIYSDNMSIPSIYANADSLAATYGRDRLTFYGAAHDPLIKDMECLGFDIGPSGYDFFVKPLGHAEMPGLLDPLSWYPQAGWFDVF